MPSDGKETVITLKGSVQTVSEFFFTAINSILYQRGKQANKLFPLPFCSCVSSTNKLIIIVSSSPLQGIYQPETFKRESKYGLTVLTTTDQGLLSYLKSVMTQMESWLTNDDVQRLVVVVTGLDSGETLERWQFNVCIDDGSGGGVEVSVAAGGKNNENVSYNVLSSSGEESGDKTMTKNSTQGTKTVKEVHDEIQAIIRQITASVSRNAMHGRIGGRRTD